MLVPSVFARLGYLPQLSLIFLTIIQNFPLVIFNANCEPFARAAGLAEKPP